MWFWLAVIVALIAGFIVGFLAAVYVIADNCKIIYWKNGTRSGG